MNPSRTIDQQQPGYEDVPATANRAPTLGLNISLIAAAPILLACLALWIGKKTGWDFYNYHWYNPYALLHGRLEFDVAVAHHATYYNALLDVPLFVLAQHAPAWLVGIFVGAMAGVAVALIGVLAYRTLPGVAGINRSLLAAALALLSVCGAGAFQEIGDPANDIWMGIGSLAALTILVAWLDLPPDQRARSAFRVPFAAGLCAGAFVALKLTAAPYALGVAVALLCTHGAMRDRLKHSFASASGIALGFAIVGGFWLFRMWMFSGNPLFPYFNDLFRSHLLLAENYRDLNFRPHDLWTALTFPWQFTIDSRAASESVFRDSRVLLFYVLLPATLLVRFLARRPDMPAIPESTRLLLGFAVTSYLAWMTVFGIYRYLIPLEMLAPLLIVLLVLTLPIAKRIRPIVATALLLMAQALVHVDLSDRQSWEGPYVDVDVPSLEDPAHTLIVMTGHEPMAYVIPFFPPTIPFVRIDSWLIAGDDRVSGLALTMRARVDAHRGPIMALFEDREADDAVRATSQYGLVLELNNGCKQVRSNVGPSLWLCAAERTAGTHVDFTR